MMYLIKGNENYFIDSKIEEIKSELAKKNKSIKVISFFEHANFEDIIVAISNIDIFSTNKLIIFKNMDFLNEKTKINKNIIDMFLLELNNIDENTEIIFSQFIEKNDPNFVPSPIFKYIEKKAINFNVKKIDDREVFQFVSKLISSKGGKIDSYVLHEFLSFLPNDLSLINNEIDKLLIENKNITSSMIIDNNLSLSSNIEWAFSNALIKYGNIADIFRKFYEQLNFGSTGINILEQITRILYDTQYIYFLKLELDSLEDVAQKSGINIYRVKLLDSFVIKVGYETIKKLIKSLAQLDVDIKKGLIDENLGIKTFMLTLLA